MHRIIINGLLLALVFNTSNAFAHKPTEPQHQI